MPKPKRDQLRLGVIASRFFYVIKKQVAICRQTDGNLFFFFHLMQNKNRLHLFHSRSHKTNQ